MSEAGADPAAAAAGRFVNYDELVGHGRTALRSDALAIAAAALAAVDPAAALRPQLLRLDGERLLVTDPRGGGTRGFDLRGRRLIVLGAGKATIGMAAVLDELLGPRIAAGVVVVKRGQAVPLSHIEVLEAAHPVPDESSLAGGLRLLEVAALARPGDLVVALVTGGSSALAVAPADGLTLADKIAANRVLLASGADIVAVNQVRKHLSRLKGGRLARAAGCEVVNLTVSDVVGDPLDCRHRPHRARRLHLRRRAGGVRPLATCGGACRRAWRRTCGAPIPPRRAAITSTASPRSSWRTPARCARRPRARPRRAATAPPFCVSTWRARAPRPGAGSRSGSPPPAPGRRSWPGERRRRR